MPTLDRRVVRLASLFFAALFIVGACGSSATPSPTTPGAATPAPGVTGTPVTATGGTDGTGFNQAPDLEAKLPSQLCGADAKKQSFSGAAGATGAVASANPMLSAFGALGAGGNFAIAIAESTTPSTCPLSVFAYQLKGGNTLMFQSILAAMASGGSQVSLGGKTVTKMDAGTTSTYLYIKDDTFFGVSDATDDQAGQTLSQLP